jgi:hypothetical protein
VSVLHSLRTSLNSVLALTFKEWSAQHSNEWALVVAILLRPEEPTQGPFGRLFPDCRGSAARRGERRRMKRGDHRPVDCALSADIGFCTAT